MVPGSQSREKPTSICVRLMTLEDVPAVVNVRRRAFAGMPTATTAEKLANQIAVFPEGQHVAVDEAGRVVASSSTLIVDWDDYAQSANWSDITSHGTFGNHNPLGKTLYGADMAVDPAARRQGVGSLFYEARKRIVKERGLKRMLTGGRIPGYAQVAGQLTPREYVAEVVMGKRTDPTLSFQLANGFVVLDVVPGYVDDDDSQGFATLLEWLNPAYIAGVSFQTIEQHATSHELGDASAAGDPRRGRVRIAAIQYLLRPINAFEDFATQAEFFVRSARRYQSDFVLFPEFFTMQLLSYLRDPAPARAVRRLAELAPQYEELFTRLATQTGMYIVAGTHPVIQAGEVFNAAHLFTPGGLVFRQKKVHLTPIEKGPYQLSRGHGFYLYHTDHGKVAILVCYDVEFPEAARCLAKAGAQIIFVPSCTDGRHGFHRVRYCAQARAIENQVYVAVTSTVGNLPAVPYMNTNYGQAAILTPLDYCFARDGIANEGIVNQEQMIVADVDLGLLEEQRITGTIIPITDLIKDAYDRVIHCVARDTPGTGPKREDGSLATLSSS